MTNPEDALLSRATPDAAGEMPFWQQLPGLVYYGRPAWPRTFLFASQGSGELTGYPPGRLAGPDALPFDTLIHPEEQTAVAAEINAAVAASRPYRCIYRLTTATGEARWVLERGRAIADAAGTPLLVGFITDHTERMLALQAQAQQLVVMEERNRLARELHDSVSQSLYSVTLFAEAGRTLAAAGELERAGQYFTDVLETGQQALKEMRLLVYKLRPSRLTQEGFIGALQHRLNAVEGRAGIKTRLDVPDMFSLPPALEEPLYHIAQEALNNGIKHAGASQVSVSLAHDDSGGVLLTIADDGRGFDLETGLNSGGMGLASMQERAALLGGMVTFTTAVGQGTAVTIHLPAGD